MKNMLQNKKAAVSIARRVIMTINLILKFRLVVSLGGCKAQAPKTRLKYIKKGLEDLPTQSNAARVSESIKR